MPRKFGNEIRLPGTAGTGIDNLPIPLKKLYSSTCAIYKTYYKY